MTEITFFTGVKTTELPVATPLQDEDVFYVVQNAQSKQTSGAALRALVAAGGLAPKYLLKDAGTALPILINNFQTFYSGYNPNPEIRIDNGDDTYTYLKDATVKVIETTGVPTSVVIDVDGDGTGHTADKLQIIFRP